LGEGLPRGLATEAESAWQPALVEAGSRVVVETSRELAQRGAATWKRVRRRGTKAALTPAAPDLAIGGDFDCSEPAEATNGDGHTPDPPSR